MSRSKISIVVSVYNEEAGLRNFWQVLKETLVNLESHMFEVIWVNDGSSDGSQNLIEEFLSESFEYISQVSILFSKNYGHESAMIAGIDMAISDAIICMDSDLQHPPESIADMILKFENGADIVMAYRNSRADNSLMKKGLSRVFYKLLNKLSNIRFSENASDFFMISKRIQQILKDDFREYNRFLRGYIQGIGYKKEIVEYNASKREFGKSNYSYWKLLKLSLNAIFSFSNKPLMLIAYFALISVLVTIVFGAYTLGVYLFGTTPPSGYTSIILFTSMGFSIVYLSLAVIAIYLSKLLNEVRRRPIYLVKSIKRSTPIPSN